MKNEQQQQAERLYFQTDLNNTEIADALGISRRTLQYWISDQGWDQLRQSSRHMPVMLAQNCYFILARLQQSILSEGPEGARVVTAQEVNMMAKLANTIHKLRTRATVNESMEMLTHFMEHVSASHPGLTDTIRPVVEDYLRTRAVNQPGPRPKQEDPAAGPASQQQAPSPHTSFATPPHAQGYTPASPQNNGYSSSTQRGETLAQHKSPYAAMQQNQHLNRAQRREMARNAKTGTRTPSQSKSFA